MLEIPNDSPLMVSLPAKISSMTGMLFILPMKTAPAVLPPLPQLPVRLGPRPPLHTPKQRPSVHICAAPIILFFALLLSLPSLCSPFFTLHTLLAAQQSARSAPRQSHRTSRSGPSPPPKQHLEEPGWVVMDVCRDLPYDYATLLENVMDVSHVPFTHHLTVGNRKNAAPVDLELGEAGVEPHGFTGVWEEGPRKGALGSQYTTFTAPTLMVHRLTSKAFGVTETVVYATPTTPGKCRLLARFPFKFSSPVPMFVIKNTPKWLNHQGQNRVLEDDQIFLHIQERVLEQEFDAGKSLAQACYLPTAADVYVSAFRKWRAPVRSRVSVVY